MESAYTSLHAEWEYSKNTPTILGYFIEQKKENSLIIEITSGKKFINCQNNPASYIFQMLQLLV
jgi:hypothetical protein